MKQNMQVVTTADFIRFDAHGHLQFDESKHALETLAKACVEHAINHALLDVRDIHAEVSLAELYRLVLTFQEMGFSHKHRLAVLHRLMGGGGATFFAMCAQDRGWNVGAFDDYEQAIQWLGVESTTAL